MCIGCAFKLCKSTHCTCFVHAQPCISVSDKSVGQSGAINYFIAAELDMLGDTTMETAQILSIQESLQEMWQVVRGKLEYVY